MAKFGLAMDGQSVLVDSSHNVDSLPDRKFDYDQAKSTTNLIKHGLDFDQAKALWADPWRVQFEARFADEARHGLIGRIEGKIWTAIFTVRGDCVRIISVRRARKDEEKVYYNI